MEALRLVLEARSWFGLLLEEDLLHKPELVGLVFLAMKGWWETLQLSLMALLTLKGVGAVQASLHKTFRHGHVAFSCRGGLFRPPPNKL